MRERWARRDRNKDKEKDKERERKRGLERGEDKKKNEIIIKRFIFFPGRPAITGFFPLLSPDLSTNISLSVRRGARAREQQGPSSSPRHFPPSFFFQHFIRFHCRKCLCTQEGNFRDSSDHK